MTSSKLNGVTNLTVSFDAIGNITNKSDVGNYTYHATKRRAVVAAGSNAYGYDANGNMTSRNGSTIVYTSYNLPSSIAAGADSSTLYYGAARNRYKQIASSGGAVETTLYVGGILERVTRGGVTEFRHLIGAGTGTVAIHTRRSSGTPATDTYYVHRDHQGSPELVTNAAGAEVTRFSFSAYGARRDSTDWSGPISAGQAGLIAGVSRRGYTDHEHLDAVGLVHMNGRVYEPAIGRFLSRDPVVMPGSQGVNGYSYVQNNPMTMVDPTGYSSTPIEKRVLETGPSDVTVYGSRWDYALRLSDLILAALIRDLVNAPMAQNLPDDSEGDENPNEPEANPCVWGPSEATGSASIEFYTPVGGGRITVGADSGHPFITLRVGYGWGAGVSYNPRGGLPVRPSNPREGGAMVTASAEVSLDVVAAFFSLEAGYNLSSQDGGTPFFDPDDAYGRDSKKGIRVSGNVGTSYTIYGAAPEVIKSDGTCQAHY